MIFWVSYDIAHDRTRTKLADSLEVVGLIRIQKSVFAGAAPKKVFWRMISAYSEKMEDNDRLFVLKLSETQFRDMHALGLTEDMDRLLGKKTVLIL